MGDLQLADGELSFRIDGQPQLWPLREVEAEALGDDVRLTRRGAPERLIVEAAAWRAATGRTMAGDWRRELRLLAGLAALGVAIVLFVFVGVPVLSGPLARMTPPPLEARLGETYAAQLQFAFPPCLGVEGQDILHAFGDHLEDGMDSPFNILVEAVEAPMVNAFALPGGRVLITDNLIAEAQTPDELAAVIAHEAAHVERRHVMQAVWRSLGLGLILDAVVGGGTGAGQQAVLLAGSMTELRYSREAEAEADARGQEILQNLGFSSQGMSPFFRRLAGEEQRGEQAAGVMEFLSTHPDSLRRAEASKARAQPGVAAFTGEEWRAIKAACDGEPRRPSSD